MNNWVYQKQNIARWLPFPLLNSLVYVESCLQLPRQVLIYFYFQNLIFFFEVNIETSKECVKFSIVGENGSGSITLKQKYDPEKKDESVSLEVDEPVNLSFALRYLNLFNKASNLSPSVILHLSNETPLVVEYTIESLGSLKFYLAPKINDEEAS